MKEKVLPLDKAVEKLKDGALIGLTDPSLSNAPMAFLRAVVRKGIKNLRVVTVTGGGFNIDFLIGAGVVEEYETSY